MKQGTESNLDLGRIVFFSDAVFAISMTLLAIDLRIPSGISPDQLGPALIDMLPDIEAFVLSFVVIGVFWNAHHRMWRNIIGWDQRILVLNLLTLLIVAFVPFPTSMLGEYGDTTAGAALYSGTVAALGLTSAATWWYATQGKRLVDPEMPQDQIRIRRFSAGVAPVIFAGAFLVAFVAPAACQLLWWSAFVVRIVVVRIVSSTPEPATKG